MVLIEGKARPKRVFKDKDGRFYVIVKGKKKYLKGLVKNGEDLNKISDVQKALLNKLKGNLKVNFIPRGERNWKKQTKVHRSKNLTTLQDVVSSIQRIGRPTDDNPAIFNMYAGPTFEQKQLEDKKETPGEQKLLEEETKGKPGRPKGSPNKATVKEYTEEDEKKEKDKNDKERLRLEKEKARQDKKDAEEKAKLDRAEARRQQAEEKKRLAEEKKANPPKRGRKPGRKPEAEAPAPPPVVEEEKPADPALEVGEAAAPERPKRDIPPVNYTEYEEGANDAADPDYDPNEKPRRRRGTGKILKALWNDQIEDFFKGEPRFTGTYSSDEIKDIPKLIPQGFIINTAKSTDDEGEHWQAIYISPDSVEFYDSYGDNPDKAVMKELKEKVHSWHLPILLKFKVNSVAAQKPDTETCGYFAMRFLDERFNGVPFDEATRFKRPENEKHRVIHEEKEGERTINKEFKLI